MRKQIIRRSYDEGLAASFEPLHPVLRRVYAARNIQSIKELDNNLEQLHSPKLLTGIDAAVLLIADVIKKNQRIMIVGDFDADGATSTAVAMRALRSFGAKAVEFLVPNRFAYGYGLTPELVAVASNAKPDLIITVDNGIANHAGVLAAIALGIRVIVTDHHLQAATLPDANAIVNPNQNGDIFPSKNLAGVGVIFYVMVALRRFLMEQNWFTEKQIPLPNMAHLLDLVALGTVADLVPLDQNNRILIHHGLRRIRAGLCAPGIIALLELAGRDFHKVTASDLGYAVASRLNAAGRLDDMSLGIECLLCDAAHRVREMARVLDQLNDERKSIEQDMQTQALEVLKKLPNHLTGNLPYGVCLYDESWHQGVIGILAARIKERLHRPVIIFAPGQSGEIKGSARSINGLHVRDVLALIDALHPGLILKFGGHAMAAGLTIHVDKFAEFSQIFDQIVSQQLTAEALEHSLFSDGELALHDFNLEAADFLREGGPWGQAFPEPLFDDEFQIVEQRIVGDKHLKLRLKKENKILEAIAFFVDISSWPNHRCEKIRAAYRIDVNEYKGRRSVQLIVDYFEPVGL